MRCVAALPLLLLAGAHAFGSVPRPPPMTCGLECQPRPRDEGVLSSCLNSHFATNPAKLVWSTSGDYEHARRTYSVSLARPTVVVFAEDTNDVSNASYCAFASGHTISAASRRHGFQGYAVVDGAVVIDAAPSCKSEDTVIDKMSAGEGILPGTQFIATIKLSAGCTIAFLLHTANTRFSPEEGAMTLTGSCPSVGLGGFVIGGGLGDITAYAGVAADLVAEAEMVTYDGSIVRASESVNPDLFWALRGGGGGLGVVTSWTVKVMQAPMPQMGYSILQVSIPLPEDDEEGAANIVAEVMSRFQVFQQTPEAVKFGGGGSIGPSLLQFMLTFLGPWDDAVKILTAAGVLEYAAGPATFYVDYESLGAAEVAETLHPASAPAGVISAQHLSYAEMEARQLCTFMFTSADDLMQPCHFLGLNESYCTLEPIAGRPDEDVAFFVDNIIQLGYEPCAALRLEGPNCSYSEGYIERIDVDFCYTSRDVVNAFISDENAGNPNSMLNVATSPLYTMAQQGPQVSTALGGLLLSELEPQTWSSMYRAIVEEPDCAFGLNHYTHGAVQHVQPTDTAYPWRDAGILIYHKGTCRGLVNAILSDPQHAGDVWKLRGYYNYLGAGTPPSWRTHYFGNNWERLTHVKGQYDPIGIFSKPVTVETPVRPERCVDASRSKQ